METSILQLTRIVNWGIVLTAENTEKANGQFPFVAALILIAIIMVVSVGDMIAVNKSEEKKEREINKPKDTDSDV